MLIGLLEFDGSRTYATSNGTWTKSMKSDIKSNSYTYIHKMLLIEGTNFHGQLFMPLMVRNKTWRITADYVRRWELKSNENLLRRRRMSSRIYSVRVEVLSSLHLMITLGFSRDPTKNEIHQALYDNPYMSNFLKLVMIITNSRSSTYLLGILKFQQLSIIRTTIINGLIDPVQ